MIVRPYRVNCDVAARGDPMTRNDHPARLEVFAYRTGVGPVSEKYILCYDGVRVTSNIPVLPRNSRTLPRFPKSLEVQAGMMVSAPLVSRLLCGSNTAVTLVNTSLFAIAAHPSSRRTPTWMVTKPS
jgi:hypothetical protein